jgi:aspartyl/asparaginyl beta-hydroxylase (cupin superfamily)
MSTSHEPPSQHAAISPGTGLARRLKALGGRVLVQARLSAGGRSPFGLGRVWAYTDDCAGIRRHAHADARQQSKHVLPDLLSAPWHSDTELGWMPRLAGVVPTLRAEAARLRTGAGFRDDAGDMLDPTWRVHLLRCLGEAIEGERGCPATVAAVAAIPRLASTGLCALSMLEPGAEVPLGNGPTNTRLRCQLGLEVPEGAGLEVAGEARSWREGEWIAWDDSYPHRVWNRSERALVLLSVDVWHPGIDDREARALEVFMRLSPESVQRRRFAQSHLGARAHT